MKPQLPNQPSNGSAPRDWSSGLCGCLDDPSSCCKTCWCPCITVGQIVEIVEKGDISCTTGALIHVALAFLGGACLYSCTYRTKIRKQYALKGDACTDCLVHYCCGFCAICQEYRELKNFGADPSIGWKANVEKWSKGGTTTPPSVYPGMTR